ncbi:hypothetical protein AVEN_209263-1 [Araneus ventricosus]|uniref:Uncharacterized protein n=1 Tax=Araneus ventricosus TaxID=182803 RepID=A0A4Y2WBX6_ARAVE|nr:hypothetical protein AVEN_209263-1 [Araneus ventricosus]
MYRTESVLHTADSAVDKSETAVHSTESETYIAAAAVDSTEFELHTESAVDRAEVHTTEFRTVLNTVPKKDDICSHQSALKPSESKKPTSVDTQLLPMAVLPPLEKALLQSRESDADAEMSSSSLSEEDALEYDMSED